MCFAKSSADTASALSAAEERACRYTGSSAADSCTAAADTGIAEAAGCIVVAAADTHSDPMSMTARVPHLNWP